jgi:hypothetical protein
MSRPVKYADVLAEWERMLAALAENATDFPDTFAYRETLQSVVDFAKATLVRQAQHTASKQTSSRELQVTIGRGRPVATVLRFIIKERYGNRSEKLAEFNLQPRRSRTQPPQLPPTETTAPAVPSTPTEDLQ